MRNLIITVGLPRSGKSTWAMETGYPMVNPDAIRLALHGKAYLRESEPMVWAIAKYMVSALFLAGHKNVVLDATNTTDERRLVWEEFAVEHGWVFWYKNFPVHRDVCMGRAMRDQREELVPVIERMAPFITYPEERLWEGQWK